MAARTVEELIAGHFRRSVEGKFTQTTQPGEPIDLETAGRVCAFLSEAQRAAVDPEVIGALDALLVENAERGGVRISRDVKTMGAFEWFKKRRSPELERVWVTLAVVMAVLERREERDDCVGYTSDYVARNRYAIAAVAEAEDIVGKRALKPDGGQVFAALESAAEERWREPGVRGFRYRALGPIVAALERMKGQLALTAEQAGLLRDLRNQYEKDAYGAASRAGRDLIDEILKGGQGRPAEEIEAAPIEGLLWEGEEWAKKINASIRELPAKEQRLATVLLQHAGTNNEYSAKPSKGWFEQARKIVEEIGPGRARELVGWWLRAFAADDRKKLAEFEAQFHNRHFDHRAVDGPKFRTNTGYMAGVAHVARCVGSPEILGILCDVVEHVAGRTHSVREWSTGVATAGLRTLEASEDAGAGAALSRVALRVRWPKLRKAAEKTLASYVKRTGMSRDEVEEANVPEMGLKEGKSRIAVGDGWAEIAAGRGDRPAVQWGWEGKQPSRVVPVVMKKAHPQTVAEVKGAVDEIEKLVAAQRTRLDLMFRREVRWPYAVWRERYLDHGLVGILARRMIWLVDGVAAMWWEGKLRDVEGKEIGEGKEVALWHPVNQQVEEVVAWRSRLEALEVTQPMKQAHREIYLLTEAERRTGTYSNRFAAHVLKNRAALAITQVRKWVMGMYGGGESSPKVALPGCGLRAEWWAEAAGDDHDRMGFPLYLVSDQVRFYKGEEREPMRLEDVPQLAFTEVMRDVDLFVGVGSVGNDPNWRDGGERAAVTRYGNYWHDYSFGELTETARTRRMAMERLLPRLKIAARCELKERFLVVRGEIRTYKIHLGSGNILMSPNDQYLCIVADRWQEGDVFLPFEGDRTLSVILSKAFLLADDVKIEDETITRQIGKMKAGVAAV